MLNTPTFKALRAAYDVFSVVPENVYVNIETIFDSCCTLNFVLLDSPEKVKFVLDKILVPAGWVETLNVLDLSKVPFYKKVKK